MGGHEHDQGLPVVRLALRRMTGSKRRWTTQDHQMLARGVREWLDFVGSIGIAQAQRSGTAMAKALWV